MSYAGSIELICGSMFSSKSNTLISRIDRFLYTKQSVIAIKWRGDDRYSSKAEITTHSGQSCDCILCNDEDLKDIYEKKLKNYEVICIDEGSFFKDIVAFCEMLANKGHTVIVASLVGNYFRTGFNDILNLIPKCEKITQLTAVCMQCHTEGAAFSKLIRKDVPHDGKEFVGGAESYMAVCRKCYYS